MNTLSTAGLVVWLLLSVASVWVWLPRPRFGTQTLSKTPVLLSVLATEVVGTGAVALLAARGGPLAGDWPWLAVGIGAAAAVVCGGATTLVVLGLADASSRSVGGSVQRTILRGGAWIGALERLALFGILLAGWPEGLAAVVAIKAFARYPELSSGQATGAIERFIIGTFTSLGWAAVCAGMVMIAL